MDEGKRATEEAFRINEAKLHRKPLDITLLIRELLPSFQPGWDARRQMFTLHLLEEATIVLGFLDDLVPLFSGESAMNR